MSCTNMTEKIMCFWSDDNEKIKKMYSRKEKRKENNTSHAVLLNTPLGRETQKKIVFAMLFASLSQQRG